MKTISDLCSKESLENCVLRLTLAAAHKESDMKKLGSEIGAKLADCCVIDARLSRSSLGAAIRSTLDSIAKNELTVVRLSQKQLREPAFRIHLVDKNSQPLVSRDGWQELLAGGIVPRGCALPGIHVDSFAIHNGDALLIIHNQQGVKAGNSGAPRDLSIVRDCQFDSQPLLAEKFASRLYVFLGEIPNRPGYCVVADYFTGQLSCGNSTARYCEVDQKFQEDACILHASSKKD